MAFEDFATASYNSVLLDDDLQTYLITSIEVVVKDADSIRKEMSTSDQYLKLGFRYLSDLVAVKTVPFINGTYGVTVNIPVQAGTSATFQVEGGQSGQLYYNNNFNPATVPVDGNPL